VGAFKSFKIWFLYNRWKVLSSIILVVITMVLWISNVNRVNKLLLENHRLEIELKDISSQNEVLSRENTQLRSPDRIIPIAQQRLGMILNDEAPVVITHSSK
jgi:cell division protein FtsL